MVTTVIVAWGQGENPSRKFFGEAPNAGGRARELALRDFRERPGAFWIKEIDLPLPPPEAIQRVWPEAQNDPTVAGWRAFSADAITGRRLPSYVTRRGLWVVNGLKLPADYVRFVERSERSPDWRFKEGLDSYGRPSGLHFYPYRTLKETTLETTQLAEHFGTRYAPHFTPADEEAARARCEAQCPGFLPDLNDFSKIVWFGRTPTGEPVCFDFRDNPREPSIIYWPDMYCLWRRVAPDFTNFAALLEPAW
jgi:hypothetical protein